MRSLVCFALFALSVVFVACGGKAGNSNNNMSEPCDGACTDGTICEPVSGVCQTPGDACETNADCTNNTYCEQTAGVCLNSAVGTPCDGPDNCDGECLAGICGCDGVVNQRMLGSGSLDIFLMLDRSGSMVNSNSNVEPGDCAYVPGGSAVANGVQSKGCFATYAINDYVIGLNDGSDTRLALDFMSDYAGLNPSNPPDNCDGTLHADPAIPLTSLPVATDSALVTRVSDEDFGGGYGTQIEGALNGISIWVPANATAGREMIGVFITDGQPNGCSSNTSTLTGIVSNLYDGGNGYRTFVIGMDGADETLLEALAIAGGAEPHSDYCGGISAPCHYYNVGNGDGGALTAALQAIQQQATVIPCSIDVTGLEAPVGETVNYNKVNVTFRDNGSSVVVAQVADAGSCPSDSTLAWYYDDPNNPTTIELCQNTCDSVQQAGDGADLAVVAGCNTSIVIE